MIELALAIFIGATAQGLVMTGVTHMYMSYLERRAAKKRADQVKELADLVNKLNSAPAQTAAVRKPWDLS